MNAQAVGIEWLPWVLALGVLLASVRLLLQARAPGPGPRRWRIAVLVVGQVLAAGLLFLLLRTSDPASPIHTLHVLTARATAGPTVVERPGERWVRLPEAPNRAGVAMTADLATALRLYPGARVLHISGDGLEARDRDAARNLHVVFNAAPPAVGITDWWAAQLLREGEPLHVVGSARAPAGARIALLDPAGTRIDEQSLQDDDGFLLRAIPRHPGLAEYRLQLRDAAGKQFDASSLQVRIVPATATRVLLLAGGPDPDLKYLRRWAADQGAQLQASIALGGGMRTGDPPFELDARTLAQADLLILDDRSWNGLDRRRRDAVLAAVDAGMGLLLRASLPLAQPELLGLRVRTATLPATYRIPAAADAGSQSPPPMERPQLRIDNPGGPVLLRDDRGLALAAWRAHGRGRIGAWLPGDTFRLALSGHGALHARQWASVLNALMRPRAPSPAPVPLRIHAGQRTLLCDLSTAPRVLAPGSGQPQPLAVDPRSGTRQCAAYWPTQPGWHRLLDASGERPFLVRSPTEDIALRAAETRRATTELAAQTSPPSAIEPSPGRVPRWLLFVAWLALMGGVWWFERSRYGRAGRATPG